MPMPMSTNASLSTSHTRASSGVGAFSEAGGWVGPGSGVSVSQGTLLREAMWQRTGVLWSQNYQLCVRPNTTVWGSLS